jgi:hypothetical protein
MNRPKESDYTSQVAYTRALEKYCDELQEQEPVAWRTFDGEGGYDFRDYDMNECYAKEWNERNPNHKNWVEPLYTTPQPQREWVGLTDEEIAKVCGFGQFTSYSTQSTLSAVAKAIEAKLKQKNGYAEEKNT